MLNEKVVNLNDYRTAARRELVDEISARTFLFLRDEAEANDVSMQTVIAEHMLGLALVVEAVEGADYARRLLAALADKLND